VVARGERPRALADVAVELSQGLLGLLRHLAIHARRGKKGDLGEAASLKVGQNGTAGRSMQRWEENADMRMFVHVFAGVRVDANTCLRVGCAGA